LELVLISLLAAFCGGLAWALDHELFAVAFAAAAVTGAFGAGRLGGHRRVITRPSPVRCGSPDPSDTTHPCRVLVAALLLIAR